MNISTKYFGDMEVPEEKIIRFNNGIPGFPDESSFVFIPLAEDSPFTVMQSTLTPSLALITASPFTFFKDYDFTISDQVVDQLEFDSVKEATVYNIITVKDPFKSSTANLVAPVLVNYKKKVAKQVVLEKTPYGVCHPLFPKSHEIGRETHAGTHAQEK